MMNALSLFRIFPLLFLFLLTVCVETSEDMADRIGLLPLPEETGQLLLVTAPSWSDSQGVLRLFSRWKGDWRAEGDDIPVVLGRRGLAWGLGLHESSLPGLVKTEGDMRAPAGLFGLGTSFGYAPRRPSGSLYPYRQATEYDYFIDDVTSPDYNMWLCLADSMERNPEHHWRSFERMKRTDDLYELGIVVRYNTDPVVAGRGSAIFLHVWRGPDRPTAGCTAMSREHLLGVVTWLDPSQAPLLVQVPEGELRRRRVKWSSRAFQHFP